MEIVSLTQEMLIVIIIIRCHLMLLGIDRDINYGMKVSLNGMILCIVHGRVMQDGIKIKHEQLVRRIVQ